MGVDEERLHRGVSRTAGVASRFHVSETILERPPRACQMHFRMTQSVNGRVHSIIERVFFP